MEKETPPAAIIERAKTLIDLFGENIVLIGKKDDVDVYMFQFPEDLRTGYPFLFLYDRKNNHVDKITGFDALDIIAELIKE